MEHVIKHVFFSSLDRDPTITMWPARCNRGRYNVFKMPRAFWSRSVVCAPPDQCTDFHGADDPARSERPHHRHQKHYVGLSPTREKLNKPTGFTRSESFRGWIPFRYTEGWLYYIYDKLYEYKLILHRAGATWFRVALPRDLACHVASTRVPREIRPHFCSFLIYFKWFKSKLIQKKSRKNP